MARNLAAIIMANGGGVDPKAAWDAVPQDRKERLERYLKAQRKNPLGPTML